MCIVIVVYLVYGWFCDLDLVSLLLFVMLFAGGLWCWIWCLVAVVFKICVLICLCVCW